MGYQIIEKNPYSGQIILGGVKGILIKEKWNDKLIRIIEKNNIKALFLNYTFGWKCVDYSFLETIPSIELIDIIDIHELGIKGIEKQRRLKEISLNIPLKSRIDFTLFENLEDCFLNWNNKVSSIFDTISLKRIYIDGFKAKDKHRLDKLLNLEELTLGNSNIITLDFLNNFKKIKVLELLNCRKILDFSPISNLRKLKRLNIDGYKDIQSISFAKNLFELEVLLLNVGKIENIDCLINLKKLKALSFNGTSTQIVDGNLEVLTKLPDLSMLMLVNRRHYSHRLIKAWDWKNFNIPDTLLELK